MSYRSWVSATLVLFAFATPDVSSAAKPKQVAVREAGWKDVEATVARHRGKVVVVDIWTTTCPSCIRKLPEFVALEKKFGGSRVALISLNCDYDGIKSKPPKFYRANVLKVLRKHGVTCDNIMLNVSFLSFLESIQLESTPAVLVYGVDGKLARRFDNDKAVKASDEFGMDDVAEFVQQLLKK